jgi:serine/threonine protein kinase
LAIPGYEILGEVGRGGMGVVYKARQVALDRLVALKMIRMARYPDGEELARFRREAQAVARLQHANIVQIHEVGETEGRPYFSLEFVPGGTLAQQLDGTPLPSRQAAALVEILARAVHHAHQRGIVHRDLKPGNVLLEMANDQRPNENGPPDKLHRAIPKITDFGLAKTLDRDTGQTQTGLILGTPSYMAPEQA